MTEALATKADLLELKSELKSEMATKADLLELKTELKAEIGWVKAEFGSLRAEFGSLRAEMAAMEQRLLMEIAKAVNHAVSQAARVYAELSRRDFKTLDEKYEDLPPRVTAVERAMEEHRGDYGLHKRPRGR